MSDKDNLTSALAAAACTLLGASVPAAATEADQWSFDSALLYYGESDNRVQDISASVSAQRVFDNEKLLGLTLTADTLSVRNARGDGQPWHVGIERFNRIGSAVKLVHLERGGLATSGDSRRFVLRDGSLYSHILDARTGCPVRRAPRSITVAAGTCTQAGTLTTLAMLQGKDAERLLISTGAQYWLQ